MAYQKLQVSNGLDVITSDSVRIPNPDTFVASGTDGDASVAGTFSSATATFIDDRVRAGAIIYATSKAYYVVSVDSNTSLTVSTADGTIAGSATVFQIYNEASPGCILFVGEAGNIGIQLAQQNGNANTTELTFNGIASGAFLPTQAIRVDKTKTTALNIIALW